VLRNKRLGWRWRHLQYGPCFSCVILSKSFASFTHCLRTGVGLSFPFFPELLDFIEWSKYYLFSIQEKTLLFKDCLLVIKFKSGGKIEEMWHTSSTRLLKAKPSNFSSPSPWPQNHSQLMNQKKAGYQMSWLINTHIAFCNGIHWASCVELRDGRGNFSFQMSSKMWVCFGQFWEWQLHRFG
jgi:hypothetical protein